MGNQRKAHWAEHLEVKAFGLFIGVVLGLIIWLMTR